MDKIYRIRRTILKVMASYHNPQTLETVLLGVDFYDVFGRLPDTTDKEMVSREWNAMSDAGILRSVDIYPEYRSLSSDARALAAQPDRLKCDRFFYGPAALGK